MELTPQQRRSLDVRSHLAVTAGAGSGKTRVLVERYISILDSSEDNTPRHILALTFTEKAAAEMKERVRKRMEERAEGSKDDRWEKNLSDLEIADISTIHAFCASLIRKEPIHCGVDPDFHVITGAEEVFLKREAMKDLFTRQSACSRPLRRLIVDHGTFGVRSMLNSMMAEKIKIARPLTDEGAREMASSFWDGSQNELKVKALKDAGEALSAASRLSDIPAPVDKADSAARFLKSISPLLEWVRENGNEKADERSFLSAVGRSLGALLTKAGARRSTSRMGSSRIWGNDLERLRSDLGSLISFSFDHGDILRFIGRDHLKERGKRRLMDLMEVYSHYEELYRRYKLKENGLDLNDLIEAALSLLEKDIDGMVEKLRSRYRYLLIDEFQDTDPRQWRMIEVLWGGDERSNLFIVGDPKQSIYGFRSADVRLFNRARDLLGSMEGGKVVSLDRNFRSRSEIMALVNQIFPDIFGKEGGGWNVDFFPLDPERGGGGRITFVGIVDKPEPELREGISVARIIKRAIREGWPVEDERPIKPGDIAVLIPARTGLRHYEEAFRREGVPYHVYKGKGFFEKQEIFDAHQLIRFLAHPQDDVALASLLKGPVFRLTDEELLRISLSSGRTFWEKVCSSTDHEEICTELRRYINYGRSLPPHSSLSRVLVESGMYGAVGGNRGAGNLDKLIEMVSSDMGCADLEEVAENLKRMLDEAPTEGEADPGLDDAVSIMTVHASKGLEWPMVCVMGMHHEMAMFGRSGVSLHPDRGLTMKAYDPLDGSLVEPPSWVCTKEEVAEMEHQEKKRLFYVACTRVKDHLVLSGKLPDPPWEGRTPSRSLMDLFLSSVDLSVEDMEAGCMNLGEVSMGLQMVGKDLLPSELEEEQNENDEQTGREFSMDMMDECGPEPEVDLSGIDLRCRRHLSSPTSYEMIVKYKRSKEDETDRDLTRLGRDLPRTYPHFGEGVPADIKGSVVHEIMQGKDPYRAVKEYGCESSLNEVVKICDQLRGQLSGLAGGTMLRESEFVRLQEVGPESIPVTGIIDLVIVYEDGSAVVVDYKTGKPDEKWDIQMSIYEDAVKSMTNADVTSRILRTKS